MSCVLRYILEDKMSEKYSSVNWKDEIKPQDVRCNAQDEKTKLRDKNIEEWDTSLLGRMLLYSPHDLLAVGCTYKSFNDSNIGWKEGDKVFIAGKNPPKAEVKSINGKKTIVYSKSEEKVELKDDHTIYRRSPEWYAVSELHDIRNVLFAHCPNTAIKKEDFDELVKKVKNCYDELKIRNDDENGLQDILSGMFTCLFIFNVVLS